ncbi:MAG: YicC family protein [Firmicutes bacterium]|nr:YicC family protein [Bacillota bacterium]
MPRSMTGFGRAEVCGEGKIIVAEMKAVNHRYSEVVVRLPRQYSPLEERIRRVILNKVSRGRIDVYLNIEDESEKSRLVKVDKALAIAYYNSLKELAQILEIPLQVGVDQVAGLPEVLKLEEPENDLETIWSVAEPAVSLAVEELILMRQQEGKKLGEDLIHRLNKIAQFIKEIEARVPYVVQSYRERLQMRVQELLGETTVDEARLAMEVAVFAERCNITEELVRLDSHLHQFRETLGLDTPIGRKLEFLVQEMGREINTIGSKANDLPIAHLVVEVKSELEKIREQIQNIE